MGRSPGRSGGGGGDSVVLHSSIALLQERFKKLERAKEKRERTATATATAASVAAAAGGGSSAEKQMSWLFFQYADLLRLPPPQPQQPAVHPRLLHAEAGGSPSSATSWPPPHNAAFAGDDEADAVDTSLHL